MKDEGDGRRLRNRLNLTSNVYIKKIFDRLTQISDKIASIDEKVRKSSYYISMALIVGGAFWVWQDALPFVGLRDTTHPKFDGDINIATSSLGTGSDSYRFSASFSNAGDLLDGPGGILVVREGKDGQAEIVAIAPDQESVNSLYMSFTLAMPQMVTVDDLPQRLLFCGWESEGRGRIVSIYARLGREFIVDSAVPGVWPAGRVSYAPWVVVPSLSDESALSGKSICRDEIEMARSSTSPACVPLAPGFAALRCGG